MAVLDTTTGCKIKAYTVTGPNPYATGGFLLDASADFSTIGFIRPIITTVGANLPPCDYEIDCNVDLTGAEAMGQGVIKIVLERYDKATMGNVTGQPGGVTVQTSKTATATTTGSSHTHTANHAHTSVTSSTVNAGGDGVDAAIGGLDIVDHTHSVDFPTLSVTTGSSTHTHQRSYEYEHNHSLASTTATNVTATEIGAVNLSGTTWKMVVYGFGKA